MATGIFNLLKDVSNAIKPSICTRTVPTNRMVGITEEVEPEIEPMFKPEPDRQTPGDLGSRPCVGSRLYKA